MKKIGKLLFAIVVLIGLILVLDILDIFKIRFHSPKWEKKMDVKINTDNAHDVIGHYVDTVKYNSFNKVVFFNTWSPHCQPCVAEIPLLNAIKSRYSMNSSIDFIAYCSDYQINELTSILKEEDIQNLEFKYIDAKKGLRLSLKNLSLKYKPLANILVEKDAIPFSCIISRDGKILYAKDNAITISDTSEIYSAINAAL
jgi:thiol-disulfide isomerase/thioredoxin